MGSGVGGVSLARPAQSRKPMEGQLDRRILGGLPSDGPGGILQTAMRDPIDNFIDGFVRVFDWTGMLTREEPEYTPKSDGEAIREVWEAVGSYFYDVMGRLGPIPPRDKDGQ